MKKAILILFVLLSAAGIRAQIRSVECTAPRPGLYERTDFTIRLTARYDNAYLQEQVALDMLITTPSGAERMLPCYWVEGASGAESRWEARFTPQEEGRYACRFRLSEQGRETSRSKTVHLDVGPAADSRGILHVRDYWTLVYDDERRSGVLLKTSAGNRVPTTIRAFSRPCTNSTTNITTTTCCRSSPATVVILFAFGCADSISRSTSKTISTTYATSIRCIL